MSELTHLDEQGHARMVEVGDKAATRREARAEARLRLSPETWERLRTNDLPKGDALAVARIAGIMGAKKTADLIPLCHPLALSGVEVHLELPEPGLIHVEARVRCTGPTGVEMEALTAVSVAALTLYDMLKSLERGLEIESIRLLEKVGGSQRDLASVIHASAYVDEPSEIGEGCQIWHFCHIMAGAVLGPGCILGQNVFVAGGVRLGQNVKIQNNVSVYAGVELEDDVFCGPSCVFTNVVNPRSQVVRRGSYATTTVRRGATIGANATIVCGSTLGRYCFIGAGAVVRGDVPDYALMLGVPARQQGWMSRHGYRLVPDGEGLWRDPETHWRYEEKEKGRLQCLNWPEDRPLEVRP